MEWLRLPGLRRQADSGKALLSKQAEYELI